ncbi:ankyrin repeat domain-containing protein 28 [Colletotrichum kahawae]|uniref:Ankyrin repeat domain-containing protein 28 n=1 Tax=Colletotrichum kahawae TaxID=34407 RepID=A0AAD9Y2X6_COLKA|nr:ankyrin repeat domain-containing protein 28 [Colletotrichum kahawae]
MQFLSESVPWLDNFIFAMAPLGIVTAVVSAIRVCGSPGLRAFIGRAQEGGGIAEAELCSSTSRDVCELYHNGAIVRVFGRPKILEIVHDPGETDFYTGLPKPTYGIYTFREYVENTVAGRQEWREGGKPSRTAITDPEIRGVHLVPAQDKTGGQDGFAPKPNLSFNIGIKKRPTYVYWLAAGLGFLAQMSVIVFGALVTHRWRWGKGDGPPPAWAFPMMTSGTILLSCGMFFCAFLVERSTKERIFHKTSRKPYPSARSSSEESSRPSPRTYVIQPGNQSIGDQTYDAFAFSDASSPLTDYVTSWKALPQAGDHLKAWLATGTTAIGFSLQFTGLRAMHSAVSVVLLAGILMMSIIGSALRTARLKKEQNLLDRRPDQVEGHELDWLAMQLGRGNSWSVKPQIKSSGSLLGSMNRRYDADTASQVEILEIHERFQNDFTLAISAFRYKQTTNPGELASRNAISIAENRWLRNNDGRQSNDLAVKLFYYRTRLAEMTGQSLRNVPTSSGEWDDRLVPLRQQVRQLKRAIESSTQALFNHANFRPGWSDVKSFAWSFDVDVSLSGAWADADLKRLHIFTRQTDLNSSRQSASWEVDQNSLEAALGLWVWSIVSNPLTESTDAMELKSSWASQVPVARIISFGVTLSDIGIAEREFRSWAEYLPGSMSTKRVKTAPRPANQGAHTIWMAEGFPSTLRPLTGSQADKYPAAELLRLCGWMSLELAQQQDDSTPALALTVSTKQSIPSLCAQDLYQGFLCQAATMLESIGGTTTLGPGSCDFYLTNDVVTKLVESVKDSGLGTQEDAYLMVIPALARQCRLPLINEVLPEIYKSANRERLAGQFTNAESILKQAWALSQGPQTRSLEPRNVHLYTIGQELAELYRNAYRTSLLGRNIQRIKRIELEDFGRAGIVWLEENKSQPWPVTELDQLIDRYTDFRRRWSAESPRSISTAAQVLETLARDDRAWCLFEISRTRDVALSDADGRPILSWAAQKGWREIVNASLEIGCEVNAEDNAGRTALSYAAQSGQDGIVRTLLENQAFPGARDAIGRTPLSYASEKEHIEVMKTLMDEPDVSVRAGDNSGRSPLHWAAAGGANSAIDLLLERRAAMNDKDSRGMTPVMTAWSEGQFSTADHLVERGARVEEV